MTMAAQSKTKQPGEALSPKTLSMDIGKGLSVQLAAEQDIPRVYLERDLSCINPETPGVHEALQVFTGPWVRVIATYEHGELTGRSFLAMSIDGDDNPVLAEHPAYGVDNWAYNLLHAMNRLMRAERISPYHQEQTLMNAAPGQLLPSIDIFNTITAASNTQLALKPGMPYTPTRSAGNYSTFGTKGSADGRAPGTFRPQQVAQLERRLLSAWQNNDIEQRFQNACNQLSAAIEKMSPEQIEAVRNISKTNEATSQEAEKTQ